MTRFDIRDRLSRLVPDETVRQKYAIYVKLYLTAMALIVGPTLIVAGAAFLPMFALAYSYSGVLLAAAMLSIGAVVVSGAYIWLTAVV